MLNYIMPSYHKKELPAIPPEDYKGTLADWMSGLINRGLWNEETPEWFGDVMISEKDYVDLLRECEENS